MTGKRVVYEHEENFAWMLNMMWNEEFGLRYPPRRNSSKPFCELDKIYPFATENLADYLQLLEMKNAKVLTVSCSGDQIINSYLQGAERVDSFDINIFSGIYTELKLVALQNLSFEEFKKFFLLEDIAGEEHFNKFALDFQVYRTLREDLSELAATTFDKIFKKQDNKGSELRKSELFYAGYDMNSLNIRNNTYLQSKEKFEKARESTKGKQINWMDCEIKYLNHNLKDRKYDVILLSNIADYVERIYPGNYYLQTFLEKDIKPLTAHLNPGGVICAAYIYDYRTEHKPGEHYRSQIDNPEIRKTVFEKVGLPCRALTFQSVTSVMPDKKDGVILVGRNVEKVQQTSSR